GCRRSPRGRCVPGRRGAPSSRCARGRRACRSERVRPWLRSLASAVVGTVLQEPGVDGGDRPLVERQVPVVARDLELGARNRGREPVGVLDRHEAVLLPVADEDGHGDRAEVEAPGPDEGEIVVEPPLDAAGRGVQVLGEAPGQDLAVGACEQRAERVPERLGAAGRQLGVPLLEQRAHRRLARERRVELDDVHLALAREPVEALRRIRRGRGERRDGGHAVRQEGGAGKRVRASARDAPRREAADPERVDERDHLVDDVGDAPAAAPGDVAVAGAVEADQAHAVLLPRGVEQPRRRRAVVAHDGEARSELVDHYSPGFSGVPGRPFGKSSLNRRATGSGTSAETSPPKTAISFTPLDETKLTLGLAITYTVSTSGARWRFSWFIWNSHSKSEITRSPFTIAFASQRCANSTTSSRKTSISTLSSEPSATRRNSTRSSIVNIGCLCAGLPTTPTTTRSKMPAARVITSRCPFVTGSYEAGQIAVIIRTP